MKKKRIQIGIIFVIILLIITGCKGKKSAKSYYKEGIQALKEGEYKKAETSLSKAVKMKSEKAEYYISYGMALIKNEKIKEALSQFDKAILDKDNKIVKENNKLAYRGKGLAYFFSNEYKKAIVEFKKALEIDELDKMDIDILSYKADAQEKEGLYKEALKTYTLLLKKDKSASIYGRKARAEQKLLQYENSQKDYEKAIDLDSNNYEWYLGKYQLLEEQDKSEEAEKVLQEALKIKPKTEEDFYNTAKVYFFRKDYNTAKGGFEKAIENKILEANFYLGQIAQETKDYTSAVEYYLKYIKATPNLRSAAVYNQLSLCYIQMEQYQEALEKIQEGISLNDKEHIQPLSYNEIIVLEHLGNYQEAQIKAKAYLKTYPEDKKMKKEYQFISTRTYDLE